VKPAVALNTQEINMTSTMEMYDPRAPRSRGADTPQTSLQSLSGKVIGFIDNTKPNFNHLVDDLADVLVRNYGVRSVLKRGKRVQSIPAPDAIIEELVNECDLIITGSGD
jgi:hypothetical protein